MKLCQNCGQLIAEEIVTCPSCGSEVVGGRKHIDEYRIEKVLHEGYSSILCKGKKEGLEEPVMIRIFTTQSGLNEKIADRLKHELEELKKLPGDYFVRHLDLRKSSDGLWYRVSEWIDSENWSRLLTSGHLQDYRVAFKLFFRIAAILDGLHQIGHFIPHLILDDIMVIKGDRDEFKVKIDYKLSRFLDPKMDRPGPMLKKLLACHPDIINQQPLDFRSDIWSLGKIFVELLTADFDIIDFQEKIDKLPLPQEVALLFKTMLAEDPSLRPRSMAEVAKILSQITDKKIQTAKQAHLESVPAPVKQIKRLRKRIALLVFMIVVLGLIFGVLGWYYFAFKQEDSSAILLDFANQYAGSVAFVMVDYQLYDGESVAYQNRTEGTAFLVDKNGYLLTNRHVACPWLEDSNLYVTINMLSQYQRPLRLEYRIYLWFDGEKAFNRLPGFSDSTNLEDIYFIDAAYGTDRSRRLVISGVARSPVKTWQLVKSPLKDDFAVLKINRVPNGLKPLPLDHHMDPLKIARLSPVITLGFPLGSRTQETTINVSVTQGHVRRTFENMLQVDTSIHSGNSGGPIIDIHGKVIGIASGVAVGWAVGPVPIATPLSDIGMILPITKAVNFIHDLKTGQAKWNGVLDLSLDAKLKKIKDVARKGNWSEAKALADKELEKSLDPTLVMAAGVMHFCHEDKAGAAKLFAQALSMDDENFTAKLMLFMIDWLAGKSLENKYRQELLALDWRSPNEFFGHLVKILDGRLKAESVHLEGYNEIEKSWLHFIIAFALAKQKDLERLEKLIQEAVLAADVDGWLFFLSLAELKKIQSKRLDALSNEYERNKYLSEIEAFSKKIEKNYVAKEKQRSRLAPFIARLKHEASSIEDKISALEEIRKTELNNGDFLTGLAFYSAMNDQWEQALEYARIFLEIKGRENMDRLSLGLLEAEVLHRTKGKEEAKESLKAYNRETGEPWYRLISDYLLDKQSEQVLSRKAEENPENLLTWHTATGFREESSGNKEKAIKHYKEALGSYLDNRIEYTFAKERIKRLRKPSK